MRGAGDSWSILQEAEGRVARNHNETNRAGDATPNGRRFNQKHVRCDVKSARAKSEHELEWLWVRTESWSPLRLSAACGQDRAERRAHEPTPGLNGDIDTSHQSDLESPTTESWHTTGSRGDVLEEAES